MKLKFVLNIHVGAVITEFEIYGHISVPVHREISTWQWALAKINIHVNEWFSEHKFHEKAENSVPSESSLTEAANLPWIVVSKQVDRV